MKGENYFEDSTDRTTLQDQIEDIAKEEKQLKEDQKEKKKQISELQKQLGGISKDQSPAQRKAIDNDKKAIDKLVGQISKSWNISRQEIIKTAVVLHEAKVGVKKIHGASWTFLTERKLPFGKKTADRLAQIGGCSFIVDNIDSLPAAYTTLWEISDLPEWMFEEEFAKGTINEDCWRKDIIEIRDKHEGKEPKEKKEPIRTLPIGIITVPKDSFEMSVDDKTFWDPDKIEVFQLKVLNALKTLTGAEVDFSKINEVVGKQEERRLEKESGDPVKDTLKVLPKLTKGIKEHIKNSSSHYAKYYGSRQKQEELRIDFFSNITITALSYKLASEFGEDNWEQYAEGTITAECLEAESKKDEV